MAGVSKKRFVVLFGPPGAGKGTQAKIVSNAYELPIVATGDIFRKHLKNKTPLGKQVEKYLAAGELVPDGVTIEMVHDTLSTPACSRGVILDGFPRTIEQADRFIDMMGEFNGMLRVIFVKVPEEVLVERVAGRLICRKCGKVYHKTFNPPPSPTVCDAGGECDLYQREDDDEEIVMNRIRVYNRQTMPLIEYFDRRGYLTVVDGTQAIDQVSENILESLKESPSVQPSGC